MLREIFVALCVLCVSNAGGVTKNPGQVARVSFAQGVRPSVGLDLEDRKSVV